MKYTYEIELDAPYMTNATVLTLRCNDLLTIGPYNTCVINEEEIVILDTDEEQIVALTLIQK